MIDRFKKFMRHFLRMNNICRLHKNDVKKIFNISYNKDVFFLKCIFLKVLTDKKNPKPYNFLGPETDRENALYRAEIIYGRQILEAGFPIKYNIVVGFFDIIFFVV